MKREPGFYWVRTGTGWKVAEFGRGGDWWFCGSEMPADDRYLKEIGERVERSNSNPETGA